MDKFKIGDLVCDPVNRGSQIGKVIEHPLIPNDKRVWVMWGCGSITPYTWDGRPSFLKDPCLQNISDRLSRSQHIAAWHPVGEAKCTVTYDYTFEKKEEAKEIQFKPGELILFKIKKDDRWEIGRYGDDVVPDEVGSDVECYTIPFDPDKWNRITD